MMSDIQMAPESLSVSEAFLLAFLPCLILGPPVGFLALATAAKIVFHVSAPWTDWSSFALPNSESEWRQLGFLLSLSYLIGGLQACVVGLVISVQVFGNPYRLRLFPALLASAASGMAFAGLTAAAAGLQANPLFIGIHIVAGAACWVIVWTLTNLLRQVRRIVRQ